MAGADGYQVDPQELTTFASYLTGTTETAVTTASNGVKSANGFDNNAFGILLAQILSAPARIAMDEVESNLGNLSQEITGAAQTTTQTASEYSNTETSNAASFTAIDGDTTS
ncbi:MAG TPA: hypothetical protein VHW44_05705 [Pseudonocardiaceae bacterium]|nr:hypothetical protein [Pseudonocardiaceae bacterium]